MIASPDSSFLPRSIFWLWEKSPFDMSYLESLEFVCGIFTLYFVVSSLFWHSHTLLFAGAMDLMDWNPSCSGSLP
jgi:hypothetical protein